VTKNNRNSRKYPGLTKKTSLKIREELLDQDYIDKLSEEDKKWLNQFNEEWIHGRVYKSKDGCYKPKFHKTKRDKKRENDANNSRNRDAFGRAKIRGNLVAEVANSGVKFYESEDTLNTIIDLQDEINNL
jgi:hypothetical protein